MSIVDFTSSGTIGSSLVPKRYDISIYQGDSFDVAFLCKDSNGDPVDLTGITVDLRFVGIGVANPTVQPLVNEPLGADGLVRVSMLDTSGLTVPGDYGWDIQLIDTDGRKRTYLGGKLTITKDLTV